MATCRVSYNELITTRCNNNVEVLEQLEMKVKEMIRDDSSSYGKVEDKRNWYDSQ
jgi:hypothetical protein